MLIREPDTRSPAFILNLTVIGLVIEGLVLASAQAAEKLNLIEGLAGQGLIFLLGLSLLYLGAQLLAARFAVPIVAGMSLSLLGAMLGWLGAFAGVMILLSAVGMLLVSFVWLPLAAVLRRGWKRPLWRAADQVHTARKSAVG